MRVFLFVFLFSFSALAQDHAEKTRAFEQFAEARLKAQKMPGLSVAVMHGDFRWSRGFGFADVENEVPARADSSYRMASVTKPMTAVAVLKLVEAGKIDLDAEVQTYVPYFPRKSRPVTVRQLLAHQGGISHYRDYEKEGRIREPKTTREAIAIFEEFDLVNEPGTAYSYSSYGYNLLGAVIEGASGKPYGEFMTEAVWRPLGMTSTRMDDPRAIIPHRVTGYVLENGQLKRSEYVDISSRFAGGGTRSTVEDMLRFIDGVDDVLKADTVDLAWTPMPTRDGRHTEYGLGFGVVSRNGRWVIAHGGSQQETRTLLMAAPRERFAVALASNFEGADLGVFEDKLVALFLGDPRPIGARSADEAIGATWEAMQEAYLAGLAHYRRHGRAMTSDRRELTKAFRYFAEATKNAELARDGRHPVAGEALTKAGSHMAAVLARRGDLDVYHREGALRFFEDYARTNASPKLDRAFAQKLPAWREEWSRVWIPALQEADLSNAAGLDVLEQHRPALMAATLRPDFAGELIALSEVSARRGDIATAFRAANIGYELYPRSPGVNGVLGILTMVAGDYEKGKAFLAASVALDPKGYAQPANLLRIANTLARGPMRLAAMSILQAGSEIHPGAPQLKARLEELRK
jgi:CubicO group peptidase (beta-lactamase class C family)